SPRKPSFNGLTHTQCVSRSQGPPNTKRQVFETVSCSPSHLQVSSKPLGKKRALLIAIRHVHRKAKFNFHHLDNLQFAHRDAEELRDTLIGMRHSLTSDRSISSISASHGYQANDIVLMKDDRSYPKHLWPYSQKDRALLYFLYGIRVLCLFL
ncbi:hypothetical protein J3R82DRAFT_7020, partial [Butyriboletus roseoflavus]